MAVKNGQAAGGQKTHKSGVSSKTTANAKMSNRGPDARHPTTHKYSLSGAESQVKKMC